MARQSGPVFIEGTLDDLTFYKMDGVYYVRMKSTLSRKKVLESPRFERTRAHASQLAEASKMASIIYRSIPKEERDYKLFRVIVGRAKVFLAEGKDKIEIQNILASEFIKPSHVLKEIVSEKQIQKTEMMFVNNEGRLVLKSSQDINDSKLKCKISHPHKGGFEMTNWGEHCEGWDDRFG